MPYPETMVSPLRAELTELGVDELRSADEVERFFAHHHGTALVMVNSVCGCAAGSARPGLKLALAHERRPDRVVTVFAGQDVDATARMREHFGDIPPSSPSFALLKDGRLVHFLPRHLIEGQSAAAVARHLIEGIEEHCG